MVTMRNLFICSFALFFFTSSAVNKKSDEKKFVIVVTSFNNAQWCVKNLETLFFQKNPDNSGFYENYRIIVIDDASLDGNAEYIEHYIHACNQQHRVTLIKNSVRKRALANLYRAVWLCEPDEIVFNYDGDDWLAHDRVFAMINELYQNQDIWITYGQFQNWPTMEMGYCQAISDEYVEKQLYRKKWWKPGQLRTFYAWLFKQVQLKDLFFEGPYFQGQFFPANSDLAIYYPMMEMAGYHYAFIPEVIYIRNVATPINDFKANKEIQILGSKLIREKELYARRENPQSDYFDRYKNQQADLFFFSSNMKDAQKSIDSCNRLVHNLNQIYIFYPRGLESDALSATLNIHPIAYTQETVKQTLIDTLKSCSSAHILFGVDGMVFTRYLDCAEAIEALERTFAYGFYLSLDPDCHTSSITGMGQPIPALNQITDTIHAWAFHYADSGQWQSPNTFFGALYRKDQIICQIEKISFKSLQELYTLWSTTTISLENVGLCYDKAKIKRADHHFAI